MLQSDKLRGSAFFMTAYALLLFLYVLLRALLLSVTYDEAWSIETYVSGSFWNIITYEPCDSNNHLLNSLFIKVLYSVLPETLFVARIPSLLAFVVFLFFMRKLSVAYSHYRATLVFFVLLTNPFMLDFFSLARGYSLSLASMSASLFYLQQFLKSNQLKHGIYSGIAAGITCLAVLSFLNFFAAVVLLLLVFQFKQKRVLSRSTFALLLPALVLALLLIYPLYKLTRYGNLYYGGTVGLYSDSYLTLFRYSSYHMFEQSWMPTVALLILALLVIGSIVKLLNFETKLYQVWPFLLLVFAILVNVIQVNFTKGYYLIDRTALFYYPLLVVLPVSTVKYTRVYQALLSWLLAVVLGLNFLFAANFSHTLVWFFDAETKQTLQSLNKLGEDRAEVLTIGCAWPLHKSMEYYLKRENFRNLKQDWNPNYYLYLNSALDRIDYYPEKDDILKLPKDTIQQSLLTKVIVFKKH